LLFFAGSETLGASTVSPKIPFQVSAAQLAWLRAHAIPFSSSEPRGDFSDLQPLKDIVGNARIVGLGEATHGDHEFFSTAGRITRFLISQMGFSIVAIEANMPEAYRLNEYLLHGQGDPKKLIEGMHFWIWDTRGMLNLVKWMRQYNASGKGKIMFTGFDMQFSSLAEQEVRDFIAKVEPAYLPTLNHAYQVVGALAHKVKGKGTPSFIQVRQWKEAAQEVCDHLQAQQNAYLDKASASEVARAIQNARIVLQGADVYGTRNPAQHRDADMAKNVEWIAAQHPKAKIVLWAHDLHIGRLYGWRMGAHLAQAFGAAYRPIGFTFYQGQYNAVKLGTGLTVNIANPAYPASIGGVFHQLGLPRFILDLREAADNPASAWLADLHDFRVYGAVAQSGYDAFTFIALAHAFDAVIFFDRIHPSRLLQR
jgi:erythromycin esterase